MKIPNLELISYPLCPYVQRSVIVLSEKGVPFRRTNIDLNCKPDWFMRISPTGKVPLLKVGSDHVLFESAVICEYLDEITPGRLLPLEPLLRAEQRSWIEFGSSILNLIAQYYSTPNVETFVAVEQMLRKKFEQIQAVYVGPYFGGNNFSMIDAVYAPIFRYFDVFEKHLCTTIFDGLEKVLTWRDILASRPSVVAAVGEEYSENLLNFVLAKDSHLSAKLLR